MPVLFVLDSCEGDKEVIKLARVDTSIHGNHLVDSVRGVVSPIQNPVVGADLLADHPCSRALRDDPSHKVQQRRCCGLLLFHFTREIIGSFERLNGSIVI